MTYPFCRGIDRQRLARLLASDPIVLTTFDRPAIPGTRGCPIEWSSPSVSVPRSLLFCVAQVRDTGLPRGTTVKLVRDMMTAHTYEGLTSEELTLVVVRPEEMVRLRVRCPDYAPEGALQLVGWSEPESSLVP